MTSVSSERATVNSSATWGEISEQKPGVTTDWNEMEAYRARTGIEIH